MLKTDCAIKNSIHKRRCCYKEHGKTHAKTEPRAEHAAIHVETVPNRMDERGQRKAIKHAQSCVIGDANRWMLQKEFHHLYPFVAATIFAMPNKTGAAARSTSQSHMARNRSGGSSFIIY